MSRLFLSYRRADSPGTVKDLFDHLKRRLPRWTLFYDHKNLTPGEDFPERLRQEVTSAKVVLVVIGPRWVELLKERQNRPEIDHVREEVRLALNAGNKVIPVLVENAAMPKEADLIDFPDLLPLLRHNGRMVRPDPDFDNDIERLAAFLDELGPGAGAGTVLAGKYKILREIGQGGMGVVFEAEQLQPHRRVAVKMILEGMDTKEVLARFDGEKEALARMDHPNIARVIDSGSSPSGKPYFVMEFVKGEAITAYCDRKKLTPNDRLNLFRLVCSAVQHAHQKGIIHRDIKPSNVLVEEVDGQPVPKVIDFGLAKALAGKLTDKTLVSETGKTVGTLIYSSPEQAAGRPYEIDTRTDVYSLGVLMYELLAGVPPFTEEELKQVGDAAMRREIIEKEPSKPSTKLSSSNALPTIAANRQLDPTKLTRLVRGELDWIAMRALEKDPNRRYETANEFSDEIERYLNHEPVKAGKPNSFYRLKKFLHRNKGPVIASGLLLVVLVGGIIGTSIGLVIADQARDAEAKQREVAETNESKAKVAAENAERATAAEKEGKNKVDQARIAEAKGKLEARRSLYIARMQLAQKAWRDGDIRRLEEILLSCVPKGDEATDLRNFEWYYLWRQAEIRLEYTPKFFFDFGSMYAFSQSGKVFAINKWDNKNAISICDTIQGTELFRLPPPKNEQTYISSLTLSPDGKHLATTDQDRVTLWDLDSRRILGSFVGYDGQTLGGLDFQQTSHPCPNLVFSPDSRLLAFAGKDGVIIIGEVMNQRVVHTLKTRGGPVTSLAFDPEGKRLASGESRAAVKIWDVEKGSRLLALNRHEATVTCLAFSRNGKKLISGDSTGLVVRWDAETGNEATAFAGHKGAVTAIYPYQANPLSPELFISCSFDGTVRMWLPQFGRQIYQMGVGGRIFNATLSADNTQIYLLNEWVPKVVVWQLNQWPEYHNFPTGSILHSFVAMAAKDKLVTLVETGGIFSNDYRIAEFNYASGKQGRNIHSYTAKSFGGGVLAISANQDYVANGKHNGEIQVVPIDPGRSVHSFKASDSQIGQLCFLKSGMLADRRYRLWTKEGKPITENVEVGIPAAPHPDGHRIAAVKNGSVVIYDCATKQTEILIEDPLGLKGEPILRIEQIQFSADGSSLLLNSTGQVGVYETATGKELFHLGFRLGRPDSSGVGFIYGNPVFALSNNGQRFACQTGPKGQRVVRLWDLSSGAEVLALDLPFHDLFHLEFSKDDSHLIGGQNEPGMIVSWDGSLSEDPLRRLPALKKVVGDGGTLRSKSD
jgi:serine/threonine protein kinase/WD40 repeat protein